MARGVAKTPTVFVNGTPFVETFTAEEISKGIDQTPLRKPTSIVTGASRGIGRAIAMELAKTHQRDRHLPRPPGRRRKPAGRNRLRDLPVRHLLGRGPRRADGVRAREVRPPRPAGEQRRHGAARAPRHPRSHRRELRRADRHQPQGAVLPHAAGRAVDGGAEPTGRIVFVTSHLLLHGVGEPRRVLHLEGRPEHGGGAVGRAPGRSAASRCSRSAPASSAPT